MLIDKSYFIGDINIPNTSALDVGERLDWFIAKYEPIFLKKLMGYGLYKAFMAGIQAEDVQPRWNDLLFGTEYADGQKMWTGIITAPGSSINVSFITSIDIVVGRGRPYDPVPGAVSVELPPQLVGKNISVEQRGIGILRPDEYTISGNILTRNYGDIFNDGETLFYHAHTYDVSANATGSDKKSMIANYVYHYWMCDQHTQTVALGEVKTKAENSVRVSPKMKMIRSWNENYRMALSFFDFLESKKDAYPEWDPASKSGALRHLYLVNEFDI